MNRKTVNSVGIDIGTTTTQVIFSRLTLVNLAPVTQVPRYEFVQREICYHSPVYRTPLISGKSGQAVSDNTRVDVKRLRELIDEQFTAAGLELSDVETGAIIITGETSKTGNARQAVLELADSLGDFVVATAGPNLESIIAGRGSGAGDYSKRRRARVLNIDIGGGTSNYVVFENGNVVDTACLNVGGHLIETNDSGTVSHVHAPARCVVDELFPGTDGSRLNTAQLETIADRMAELVYECIEAKPSTLCQRLLMTQCLKPGAAFDAVFISGGVGDAYYRQQQQLINPFTWNDIGALLARSLLRNRQLNACPLQQPAHTLEATVIGAGAYSLSLSGSSIWLNTNELPVRNLPVVLPNIDWQQSEPDVCNEIVTAVRRMDLHSNEDRYAVAFGVEMPVRYQIVSHAARQLAQFYQLHGNQKAPAVIVTQNDLGKVLGMELQPLIDPQQLLVIDEVTTREGDYIDIGQGFFGGDVVPLTIKSLAFPA